MRWWLRLLGLLLLLPLSAMWLLVTAVALGGVGLMLFLCLPLAFLQATSQIESTHPRWLARVALIVSWPCLGAIALLVLLIAVCLYPCLRKNYHHGAYDPLDSGFGWIALGYISLLHCLLSQS